MAQNLFSNFTIFNKENLGSVRALIDENGEPWFLANDIGDCLGFENIRPSVKNLPESDRKALSYKDCKSDLQSKIWDNPRDLGHKNKTLVSEYGMYQLIMRSDKPGAREFQLWVTHEVIPSIRKYGGYIMGQEKADEEVQEWLFDQLVSLEDALNSETEKNGRLKSKIYKMDEGHQSTEKLLNMYMEEADTLKKKVEELNNLIFAMSNPVPKEKEAKPKEFYVDEQGFVHSKNYKKNNNN